MDRAQYRLQGQARKAPAGYSCLLACLWPHFRCGHGAFSDRQQIGTSLATCLCRVASNSSITAKMGLLRRGESLVALRAAAMGERCRAVGTTLVRRQAIGVGSILIRACQTDGMQSRICAYTSMRIFCWHYTSGFSGQRRYWLIVDWLLETLRNSSRFAFARQPGYRLTTPAE